MEVAILIPRLQWVQYTTFSTIHVVFGKYFFEKYEKFLHTCLIDHVVRGSEPYNDNLSVVVITIRRYLIFFVPSQLFSVK